MFGLDVRVISISCLHRALKKIHIGKLFAYGKSLLMEKSKAEETPWEKKRKKTGLTKEERVPLMKA